MLRVTRLRLLNRGHLAVTRPKNSDRPGMWGPSTGPNKDTLQRRTLFYRMVLMSKIGRLTKPFRTPRARWVWRKIQLHVWKSCVMTVIFVALLLFGNAWLSFVYHAYAVGATTPVLERKVREHRVSKQILQMVRERERDVTTEFELEEAKANIASQSK